MTFSILGHPGGQINQAGGQIRPPQDLLGNSHMCMLAFCVHPHYPLKEMNMSIAFTGNTMNSGHSSTLAMLRPQLSGVGEVGCVVGSIAAVPKRSQQFPDHDEANPRNLSKPVISPKSSSHRPIASCLSRTPLSHKGHVGPPKSCPNSWPSFLSVRFTLGFLAPFPDFLSTSVKRCETR